MGAKIQSCINQLAAITVLTKQTTHEGAFPSGPMLRTVIFSSNAITGPHWARKSDAPTFVHQNFEGLYGVMLSRYT
jgi:hypothetical protein